MRSLSLLPRAALSSVASLPSGPARSEELGLLLGRETRGCLNAVSALLHAFSLCRALVDPAARFWFHVQPCTYSRLYTRSALDQKRARVFLEDFFRSQVREISAD